MIIRTAYPFFFCFFFLLFAYELQACNVPVYRYALERWPAEAFEAFLLYDAPLSPEQETAAKSLEAMSKEGAYGYNLSVKKVDLHNESPANRMKWSGVLSLEPSSFQSPRVLLRFPPSARNAAVVENDPLNESNAYSLGDSPIRRQIASKLLKGETAVWLFLNGGDAKRDRILFDQITQWLDGFERTLKLPDFADVQSVDAVELNPASESLQIQFSSMRISRNDPAEKTLVNILLRSEPDLLNYKDTPMLFPVFGRGKILYGLIGEGINQEMIREAAEFLIGPCSCLIKDDFPCMDLLLPVNWDKSLQDFRVQDRSIPPPFGLAQIAGASESVNNPSELVTINPSLKTSGVWIRTLLIGVGLITLFNGIFFVRMMRKR